MNCLQCKHWNLKDSPLSEAGFGRCDAITDAVRRAGQTFAGNTPCRLGKFQRASNAELAERAKAGEGPR